MIRFQDVKITDRQLIQSYTLFGERQNCDLSFANIISWRFLYNTEFAIVDDFLAFRFYTGNHLAYMAPLWAGDWSAEKQKGFANVVRKMHADSTASGHPFLMLGVCGKKFWSRLSPTLTIANLTVTMPTTSTTGRNLRIFRARSCSQSATIATNSESCFPTTSTVR